MSRIERSNEKYSRAEAKRQTHKPACDFCDGSGIAYTMMDETEIGQAPGSSAIPCPECSKDR